MGTETLIKTPQTCCEGCKARDRLIERLAKEVDRLSLSQKELRENDVAILRHDLDQTRSAVHTLIQASRR